MLSRVGFFGLVAVVSLAFAGCTEKPSTRWLKGNLHTHSFWSDGDDFPESILAWYVDHDYDFVAISDHNTVADSERWLTISMADPDYATFQDYLEEFGMDWVEHVGGTDSVSVRLKTFAEYAGRFNNPGEFLVMRSEEISDRFERKPIHLNITNSVEYIAPQGGTSVVDVMQRNIDAVLEQRRVTGQPMLPHINHPNFGWAITAEELAQVEGERFIEVYNGHPAVHNEGDSLRPSVEMIWDYVNTRHVEEGRPLVFGIGVDDSHDYREWGMGHVNPGRAWIMVNAEDLSAGSIIEAMESGAFYVSTGVQLDTIVFDGSSLSITVQEEAGVEYTIQFIGTTGDQAEAGETSQSSEVLYEVIGTSASYTLSDSDLFVRAKVISSKLKDNPYREGEMERAWTQPVSFE
ncbi:MAG: hypothetical protein BMS9Abin05_0620 [Rhodothermia bacterium]|nr:MAG: hypothetical protein BMS9Abin05_0620 [Rhodothermia bacterium]